MGFQAELSYHQILYPNINDTRKIFLWFQELLPKSDERPSADNRASVVNKAIDEELTYLSSNKGIWTPTFCSLQPRKDQNHWRVKPVKTYPIYSPASVVYYSGYSRKTEGLEKYFARNLPYVTEQTKSRHEIASSIFESNIVAYIDQREKENEWNTLGLESGLNPIEFLKKKQEKIRHDMSKYFRDALSLKVQTDEFATKKTHQVVDTKFSREMRLREAESNLAPVESEEELEKRRADERDAALEELKEVENKLNEMEVKIQQYNDDIRQYQSSLQVEESKTNELADKYTNLKTVFDLLPDAKNNILKLEGLAEENANFLKKLADEWEQHRLPLIEQYRALRDKVFEKEEQAKKKIDVIKTMRAKMEELIEDINEEDEKYNELLDVYKQLPKDNRSNYTHRILEMVKNVKKQIVEIDKILIDTKSLQKEINSTSETLNRSFAVTEDMIFQDVKKIQEAATLYKRLASMNDTFNSLAEIVSKTGNTRNDVLNLNEKILKIQTRTSALNHETMNKDLAQVKDENKLLVEKVKRIKAKYLNTGETVKSDTQPNDYSPLHSQ